MVSAGRREAELREPGSRLPRGHRGQRRQSLVGRPTVREGAAAQLLHRLAAGPAAQLRVLPLTTEALQDLERKQVLRVRRKQAVVKPRVLEALSGARPCLWIRREHLRAQRLGPCGRMLQGSEGHPSVRQRRREERPAEEALATGVAACKEEVEQSATAPNVSRRARRLARARGRGRCAVSEGQRRGCREAGRRRGCDEPGQGQVADDGVGLRVLVRAAREAQALGAQVTVHHGERPQAMAVSQHLKDLPDNLCEPGLVDRLGGAALGLEELHQRRAPSDLRHDVEGVEVLKALHNRRQVGVLDAPQQRDLSADLVDRCGQAALPDLLAAPLVTREKASAPARSPERVPGDQLQLLVAVPETTHIAARRPQVAEVVLRGVAVAEGSERGEDQLVELLGADAGALAAEPVARQEGEPPLLAVRFVAQGRPPEARVPECRPAARHGAGHHAR
mmetsp:Transcript_84727/g.182667  ORF Transcript_84727/g.182667 Transcript_84727/m.182667 type:complete len:450 (-) Transcript_84727:167-1516(-)